MVRNQGRVTRFVVMAVLQAARAQVLGLPRDSAYSWGLNRAIFYAAAKRGMQPPKSSLEASQVASTIPPARNVYLLGDEEAFRDPESSKIMFKIGDRAQTVDDFEKQVIARFGMEENFRAAWDEAAHLVGAFDRTTLESRRQFYSEVYKPRRDELSDEWSRKYSPQPKSKW